MTEKLFTGTLNHNQNKTKTVCQSRSSVHRFLGSTSTKQGKCDLLKGHNEMCTGRGSNQGPLGPKSDALTTAPLRHLLCNVAVILDVIIDFKALINNVHFSGAILTSNLVSLGTIQCMKCQGKICFGEVLTSRGFCMISLSTYNFSTLYTTFPHNLV